MQQGCNSEFPLVSQKINHQMVKDFWARQNFSLGIDSEDGNCTACPLVGVHSLIRRIRRRPWIIDWWIEMEESAQEWARGNAAPNLKKFKHHRGYGDLQKWVEDKGITTTNMARFSERFSMADLKRWAESQETMPEFDDDGGSSPDCYCTD